MQAFGSFSAPFKIMQKIDDLARKTGTSRSRLIRDAVIAYYDLDKEKPSQKEKPAENLNEKMPSRRVKRDIEENSEMTSHEESDR